MPVESPVNYISDLNSLWPLHATDFRADGADHLRLIKAAIKGSFPNVAGAAGLNPLVANKLSGIPAGNSLAYRDSNWVSGVTLGQKATYLPGATIITLSSDFSVVFIEVSGSTLFLKQGNKHTVFIKFTVAGTIHFLDYATPLEISPVGYSTSIPVPAGVTVLKYYRPPVGGTQISVYNSLLGL